MSGPGYPFYGPALMKVSEDGNEVLDPVTELNFTGAGVALTPDLQTGRVTVDIPGGGGGGGTVDSVVAGSGISVDATDPANPIVASTVVPGGQVDSVVAGSGVSVDASDPANPIVSATNLRRTIVTLDDATLKASPTSNPVLIPAVAGHVIMPLSIVFVTNFAAIYTNLATGLAVYPIGNGAGQQLDLFGFQVNNDATAEERPSRWLASTTRRVVPWLPVYRTNGFNAFTFDLSDAAAEWKLLVNNGANGNFTGGDAANVLTVTLDYVLVPTT